MTTLVVDELKTTLTQTITFNQYRKYHIEAIKIKLLMFNAPSGTFTLTIKQGGTSLASKSFTSADIKTDLSTSDNYAYLYKALDFDNSLILKNGTYDFELSSSGYTFSNSSYLGWIKSHENIFNDLTTVSSSFQFNPYDVLIYERRRGDLLR